MTESFTPGTAKRLGLDYETLRKRKPELIMFSSCMRGQTGPEATHTGFGLHEQAFIGAFEKVGLKDGGSGAE